MQRPVAVFGSCFAAAQDKSAQAWAYMPMGEGGTFTNSGANGSAGTYWLTVRVSAPRAEIRLFGEDGARPSKSLIEAVDQCR
jgi:hypothetical protein